MADEQLRLRATFVDEVSRPLDNLRRKFREVGAEGRSDGGLGSIRQSFRDINRNVKAATQEISTGFAPAISRLGLTTFTAAGAFATATLALRNFASQTTSLKRFSGEVGIASKDLRAWIGVGERFGMQADQMKSSLLGFSDQMYLFRKRATESYFALHGMGKGALAEMLVQSKDTQEALKVLAKDLAKEPAERRRQVLALLGLPPEFSEIIAATKGELGQAVEEMKAKQAEISKDAEQNAERFNKSWQSMMTSVENLKNALLAPELKTAAKDMDILSSVINKLNQGRTMSAIKEVWRYSTERPPDRPFWSRSRAFTGEEKSLSAQIANKEREVDAFEGRIKRGEAAGVTIPQAARDNLEKLREELKKLREELEKTNRASEGKGAATVQQQSFGGAFGEGGARIYQAGLPGGNGGLPYGTIGGGLSGFPREGRSASRGDSEPSNIRPRSSGEAPTGTNADVVAYIRGAAKARGIDPDIALRVATSEGLRGYNPSRMTLDRGGDRGTSFGPYQLHYKSNVPGYTLPGLGDKFSRATGLHASDPSTWKRQVDFALDEAAKGGWAPWHGWRGGRRAGLEGARPLGGSHEAETGSAAGDVFGSTRGQWPKAWENIDLLGAYRRGMGTDAAPQKVEGSASLDITLNGLPGGAGLRTKAMLDGMFRDVKVRSGAPMQSSDA